MTLPKYAWPSLPVTDPDVAAEIMAERLGAAWDDLERERLRVAASLTMGRKAEVDKWLKEFLSSVSGVRARTAAEVERFLALHLAGQYQSGVESATGQPLTWTQAHTLALTALAVDTYGDFLARAEQAGQVAQSFAAAVREASAVEIPKIAAGGRTARQVADRLEKRLVDQYGIDTVTYRDGSRVPVRQYARMVARTKSAVAYNSGTMNGCLEVGVGFVEVMDGTACGWTGHGDPDKANGTVRSLAEASVHPISHPNCRRAFAPRPDVSTAAEAAAAVSSIPADRQADQSASERRAARPASRAAAVKRARKTAQRSSRSGSVVTLDQALKNQGL